MRKRSMSVFVPKDGNRLSRRFEGVASDNEAHSDSEEDIKSEIVEEDEALAESWTKTDYDLLVEKLRATLPKKDTKKYTSQMAKINWDEIEIRQHSPEEIRKVAESLIAKVRSYRTLGDVLNDVPEVVAKILALDKPKLPLSSYNLFTKDNLLRWREEYPNMKSKELFGIASKAFHELSAKKRRRYDDAAAKLKAEYQDKLAKYFEEHPDQAPIHKSGKPGKNRLRQARKKNPFNLFYESRLAQAKIPLTQARAEWEELPYKSKLEFIRKSFAADDEGKLLNKKEQEMLDRFHGKPESVGRSVFDYYKRQQRHKYEGGFLTGLDREKRLNEDYKALSERERLEVKVAYLAAKEKYVEQYQAYIKNLPEDKRKTEIEHLQGLISKDKPAAPKKPQAAKEEELYPGSAEEDPPAAESTTIKRPPSKKTKKAVPSLVKEEDDEITPGQPSPSKRARMGPPPSKKTTPVVATPPATKSKKKSTTSSGEDSSSSEIPSTSKNGKSATKTESTSKKRPSPVKTQPPPSDSKRAKKSVKVEEEEEAAETPQPIPKEPERPPT